MRIAQDNPGRSTERSRRAAGALAVALLLVVGAADVLTGREASMILLYLAPISIAALIVSTRLAVGIAVVAAVIATAVRTRGQFPLPPEMWNAATRVAVLLSWALLLGRLRTDPHGAAPVLRQLRWMLAITLVLGLLATGVALLVESRTPAATAADPAPRPEGVLAELVAELQDCLAISRPVLLGSRDPAGFSCVSLIKTGQITDTLPSNMADYNGGPGTTLGALIYFDRAGMKSAADDFNWHQTRLRRFLENQRAVNARAAKASAELARRAMELAESLDHVETLPASLKVTGYQDRRTWPGFCLVSLDAAVAAQDAGLARRWAMEFAAATFALDDLHRWLGFLVENHLRALDFQKLTAPLFTDPAAAAQPYDMRLTISQFPAGILGLNGASNYLEIERQGEQLMTVPTEWLPALTTSTPWKNGSTWVLPGVRECYMKLYTVLSPANQKTWRQAARTPYERSYMVNMLFRAWKADGAQGLSQSLRRFDATHPNATMNELMDALMYRGHAFAGFEWADRYQPELLNPMAGAFESDPAHLLAAAQLASRLNQQRSTYGMTFTLRSALAMKRLDCVRITDMIAAIHRNAGGTGVGFVNWSAGTCAHTLAALMDDHDGRPRTRIVDGMTLSPAFEAWPNAYFKDHPWPPGFDGNPPPYSAELYARGIDNYIWAEGYIIRGPHAGTLRTRRPVSARAGKV